MMILCPLNRIFDFLTFEAERGGGIEFRLPSPFDIQGQSIRTDDYFFLWLKFRGVGDFLC